MNVDKLAREIAAKRRRMSVEELEDASARERSWREILAAVKKYGFWWPGGMP